MRNVVDSTMPAIFIDRMYQALAFMVVQNRS
jgi:hypothetical protein